MHYRIRYASTARALLVLTLLTAVLVTAPSAQAAGQRHVQEDAQTWFDPFVTLAPNTREGNYTVVQTGGFDNPYVEGYSPETFYLFQLGDKVEERAWIHSAYTSNVPSAQPAVQQAVEPLPAQLVLWVDSFAVITGRTNMDPAIWIYNRGTQDLSYCYNNQPWQALRGIYDAHGYWYFALDGITIRIPASGKAYIEWDDTHSGGRSTGRRELADSC